METVTLNNGLRVLAKRDKHGLSAKAHANRTQANNSLSLLEKERNDLILSVTYSRPFYVVVKDWQDVFNGCCDEFKEEIRMLAVTHNKTVMQVYLWWHEYSESVGGEGGQSALMSEFQQWYHAKLTWEPMQVRAIDGLLITFATREEYQAWACGNPTHEIVSGGEMKPAKADGVLLNPYSAREVIRTCLDSGKTTMDAYVAEQSRWLRERFPTNYEAIIKCMNECDVALATDLSAKTSKLDPPPIIQPEPNPPNYRADGSLEVD